MVAFPHLPPPSPGFSQVISPEKTEPSVNPEEIQTELDEEMENDICKVWDMSMDEVGAPRRVTAAVFLMLRVFSLNPVPKRLGKGI